MPLETASYLQEHINALKALNYPQHLRDRVHDYIRSAPLCAPTPAQAMTVLTNCSLAKTRLVDLNASSPKEIGEKARGEVSSAVEGEITFI